MSSVKHTSRVKEKSKNASKNTIVFFGTKEEMENILNSNAPGEINEEIGKITSVRLYQAGGTLYECELVAESGSTAASGPDTSYGKKSAQLHGTMLSIPLENHKDYRVCWNHYLFAAPGTSSTPGWWSSATEGTLSDSDAEKYAWGKSIADAPTTGNKRWKVLKNPEMPGVDSYDVATYSVVISARFSTPSAAGEMVANMLNNVGSPGDKFGITGGNWKCDNADVSWTGKYWLATLTWTRSGDNNGWNTKLYG